MALFDLPLDRLEQYLPQVAEPEDFDSFWQNTLKQAEAYPVIIKAEPVPDTGLRLLETWDITYAGFDGDPIRAWYTRPTGSTEPLPAVVEFAGYGRGRGYPHERLTWPTAGYAHLLMDTRGQGGQYGTGGDTPDPHNDFLGGPGAITRGILDPQKYYYRRLITDAVRSVAALRALPGVDPTRIAAVGNSQGGGLAIAVAGLVPDLAALMVTAPFLCHLQQAIDMTDAAPYGEIVNFLAVYREAESAARSTLAYVDGVNFARRAKAPAHFGTGLRDNISPPRTVFAAYNHYGTASGCSPAPDKQMHVYPFNHHEDGEAVHVRRQMHWLAPRLGM